MSGSKAISTDPSGTERSLRAIAVTSVIALSSLAALVAAFVALRGTTTFEGADDIIEVPRSHEFTATLTEAGVYDASAPLADLVPADGYLTYDLGSTLFSDSSDKIRLLHVPPGSTIESVGDGMPQFPEGTVLVKTFLYNDDERDPSLGRRIIETRLLVLTQGLWNVATYVWNDEQTEASLELGGSTTAVNWIDASGQERSIQYEVPDEVTCMACHQQSGASTPLGPELRHLNFDVERDGLVVNQLRHLTASGALDGVDPTTVAAAVDYLDSTLSITERGRAYLDMNCAHCHNPGGWEEPAGEGLDFRIETPLTATGILEEEGAIARNFREGEMPFLGTTTIDDDGLGLVLDYLANN